MTLLYSTHSAVITRRLTSRQLNIALGKNLTLRLTSAAICYPRSMLTVQLIYASIAKEY